MKKFRFIIYFLSFSFLFAMASSVSAANVFYSVGQTAIDLKTGGPSVSIASGVATFSVAQVGNIGVGDRVTYNTTSVAYIASKTSTTVWNLVTATGGVPANVTNQTINSITREYTSLSAAEAGASDSNHLNTTDLVAGNYQLNFPCYYDTGADTTTVTISGWTTGVSNYIKAYTPNNTSTEVNTSQRHAGKWEAGKYVLSVSAGWSQPLGIAEQYVTVDGLQVENTEARTNDPRGIYSYAIDTINSNIKISNNIIRLSGTGTPGGNARGILAETGLNTYIWNNIIYDCGRGIELSWFNFSVDVVIYNNTLVDNVVAGIEAQMASANNFRLFNNLVQDSVTGYSINWMDSTGNNLSEDATSPDISFRNKIVTFVDEAGDDFHLSSLDGSAKRASADLSADANLAFNVDIDGESRVAPWDIGADQIASNAYLQSIDQKENSLTDGLVLYQSFDGQNISGNTALDSSGLGNHGTISGATPVAGKRGQALSFDGTDDLVTLPNLHVFGADVTAGTFSAWVKLNTTSGGCYDNGQSSELFTAHLGSDTSLGLAYDGGSSVRWSANITGMSYQTNQVVSGCSVSPDVADWNYITMTWTASGAVNLYKNGTLVGQDSTYSLNFHGTPDYKIGATWGGDTFKGKIDEVRVYNRALSPDEIGSLYRLGGQKVGMSFTNKNTDGLVGMWSFDGNDIYGNTAYDRSGLGNNGAISGAIAMIGKGGQALSFNGSSDNVNGGDPATLDMGLSDWTISAWIYPSSSGSFDDMIINKKINFLAGYDFKYEHSTKAVTIRIGSTNLTLLTSPNSVLEDTWTHVTATFDRDGLMSVFINGVDSGTSTNISSLSGNSQSNSTPFAIGFRKGATPDKYFVGKIDEVRIYNRALSAAEVEDLYRLGQAKIKR